MKWWFSCYRFTVFVKVDRSGVIIETAPVTRKFRGQPLANLERWFKQLGGFKKKRLRRPK